MLPLPELQKSKKTPKKRVSFFPTESGIFRMTELLNQKEYELTDLTSPSGTAL